MMDLDLKKHWKWVTTFCIFGVILMATNSASYLQGKGDIQILTLTETVTERVVETKIKYQDVIYGIVDIVDDTIYYDVLVWNEDIGFYLPLNESYKKSWSYGNAYEMWDWYVLWNNSNASGKFWRGIDDSVSVREIRFPLIYENGFWSYDTYGYNWVNVRETL